MHGGHAATLGAEPLGSAKSMSYKSALTDLRIRNLTNQRMKA